MQMIPDSILPNVYLQNCQDTVFTVLLRHAMIEGGESLHALKKFTYVHGLIQYPQWSPTSDVFQFIKPEHLVSMKEQKTFFVFDASTEGFSPIYDCPFFEMLYFNCEKYSVDPKMIIYVSANLKDELNILKFAADTNRKPFNVFSFLSFEQVLAISDEKKAGAAEEQYQVATGQCEKMFAGKLFSSLSRINRQHRTAGTFMLCTSDISKHALISHDALSIDKEHIPWWLEHTGLGEVKPKEFKKWIKGLPLIVDRKDFNINWAINRPYRHIHDQTLFQIVNETLVLDHQETSLFYSEKTFRPVSCFQPFVIYGQYGCNYKLKELGYNLYDEWFDLSFDYEKDPILRYKKLLTSLTSTVNELLSMSREDQIQWRFKSKEILIHNFQTMIKSNYSKNKLAKFLHELDV